MYNIYYVNTWCFERMHLFDFALVALMVVQLLVLVNINFIHPIAALIIMFLCFVDNIDIRIRYTMKFLLFNIFIIHSAGIYNWFTWWHLMLSWWFLFTAINFLFKLVSNTLLLRH